MRKLFTTLILAVSAVSATADTIAVRSGEHDDFTRLVFYLPADTAWELREDESDYSFRVENQSMIFDLDGVFDFIPRSRIVEISSRRNRADIEIGCNCHARAFDYREDIVVIDIVDGPSPDAGETGSVPPGHEAFKLNDSQIAFPILPRGNANGSDAPRPSNPTNEAGLEHIGALLGRQVSQAMVNGWAVSAPVVPTQQTLAMPPRLGTSLPGIELETPIAAGPFDEELKNRRATCLPASFSDVGAWASGLSVMDAISSGRRAISRSAAQPDPDAVLHLVRAYTHAGFGAEADALVDAFGLSSRAARVAAAIARTIDTPMNGKEPELATQIHCDTSAALWAFLALSDADKISEDADLDAVQRTLTALPVHLRRHIGPIVAERLAAAGERERAAAAALTVSRTGQSTNVPVNAQPAARGQSPRTGAAERSALADIAPLISELERLASLSGEVTVPVREQVEAKLHELKGIPGAAELLRAYSRALTASGDAPAAVATLERLQKSAFFEEFDPRASLATVLDTATIDADDGVFLETVDAIYGGPLRPHAPDESTNDVTRRVLGLGYPGLVTRLGIAPSPQAGDLRKEYLARLALAEGDADRALARLEGSTTSRAAALRAEALEDLGAFGAAADAYLSMGNTEDAARAYWLAGAWGDAARLLAPSPRRDLAQRFEDGADTTAPMGQGLDTSVDVAAGQPDPATPPDEASSEGGDLVAGPRIGPRSPPRPDGETLSLQAVRQALEDSAEFRALAGEFVRAPPDQ